MLLSERIKKLDADVVNFCVDRKCMSDMIFCQELVKEIFGEICDIKILFSKDEECVVIEFSVKGKEATVIAECLSRYELAWKKYIPLSRSFNISIRPHKAI